MMGLNDKALEMAELLTAANIANRLELAGARQCEEPRFKSWDGKTCFDCGEDIPEARIKLGRVRCVYCQTAAEKGSRR